LIHSCIENYARLLVGVGTRKTEADVPSRGSAKI